MRGVCLRESVNMLLLMNGKSERVCPIPAKLPESLDLVGLCWFRCIVMYFGHIYLFLVYWLLPSSMANLLNLFAYNSERSGELLSYSSYMSVVVLE